MRELEISLDSIDKVKSFIAVTTKFDAEIDLISGRYIIDAKSIMGIFSIDLSKPIRLRIYEGREDVNEIIDALSAYVKK
ncbi:MAG: HPr family phosphocarrier protein [Lachnospiraceae bacterium]|jgi:phosphotransferase system HPr-like phosphotransfer protein|nr:HPr family phosphocarrier protein [Lachnospiraceae bacterium]